MQERIAEGIIFFVGLYVILGLTLWASTVFVEF